MLPITAMMVFGLSSPASAWTVQNGCASYRICFYGNTDFGPSSEVLNIAREYVPSYVAITPGASVACTQGAGNSRNWNDCASSVKDKMTAYDTCAYSNIDYNQNGGIRLLILHGEQIANLGAYGFNDIISSSHYTSVPSC
jgi:hypothetical protein